MAERSRAFYYLQNLPQRLLIRAIRLLPPRARYRVTGWLGRRIILNVPALRRRIADNLALIYPDMPLGDRDKLLIRIASGAGRNLSDAFDNQGLAAIAPTVEIPDSAGLRALKTAAETGQGAILVSGHFGRFDVGRAALGCLGLKFAAVYRPQNNPYANADILANFNLAGGPLFARGATGMRGLIRHLRGGGFAGILMDQKSGLGETLDFMGQPAMTSTDVATMALRYNLLVVPGYALRTDEGQSFRLEIEPPLPHSDAITMTQALNDSLAAQVFKHPEEWHWLHRRWAAPKRGMKPAQTVSPASHPPE